MFAEANYKQTLLNLVVDVNGELFTISIWNIDASRSAEDLVLSSKEWYEIPVGWIVTKLTITKQNVIRILNDLEKSGYFVRATVSSRELR